MASKIYTVIAGAGPGTGAAVARKFAEAYPIVVLARRPESYDVIVSEINKRGGSAVGIPTDVSDGESVKNAFKTIDEKFGNDSSCAVKQTESEFVNTFNINCKGGFFFSQAVLPRLLNITKQEHKYPPTLLFTGATAALKASARFSSFASGKFATRALAQSLAKEFGPQDVHVGHVIIDGVIDLPSSKEYLKDAGTEAKISPDSIADTYWYLHTQPLSGFTQELDVRPWVEKR